MIISESLKEAIKKERKQREDFSDADLMSLINKGEGQEAVDNLIFFTTSDNFLGWVEILKRNISGTFDTAEENLQEYYLKFLFELTLSLRSFLPRWNLQNTGRHSDVVLGDAQIKAEADKIQALVVDLAAQAAPVAEKLLVRPRMSPTRSVRPGN